MRITGVVLVALLLATACSGGDHEAASAPTPRAAAGPAATAEPEPEPTATDEPEPEPPTTPEPADADAEGAAAAWSNFWIAVSVPDDDTAGFASALEWGTQEAIESVRSFPWGSTDRDVANYPVPVDKGDGTFMIDDCMFHTPGFGGGGAVWWTGSVAPDTTGAWKVTSADRVSQFDPCVPAEINNAAIAGYEAYLDARLEYWDPASPGDPLIDKTTTGEHRVLTIELVGEAATNGWALRGRPGSHPEVVRVASDIEVVILDCQLQNDGRGVFEIDSDVRLDDLIPPVREGQHDISSIQMKLEDGRWKAADVQGQTDLPCEYAPTEDALPVV